VFCTRNARSLPKNQSGVDQPVAKQYIWRCKHLLVPVKSIDKRAIRLTIQPKCVGRTFGAVLPCLDVRLFAVSRVKHANLQVR
jgi:hypothetical protein